MRWLMVQPGPNFSVADVHNGWSEALKSLGEDVAEYNLDRRLQFYDAALLDMGITNGSGQPMVRKAVDRPQAIELAANGILSACYQQWPDVVLFTSAFFIPEHILQVIRARGHKIVMLFTEAPYQTEQQLAMAQYADLSLVNDPTGIERYPGAAVYAPHSYRPSVHYPAAPGTPKEHDLAFVGTGFPSRVKFFEAMELGGLAVHLAGPWLDLPEDSPLRDWTMTDDEACVDNDETAEIYRQTRCGINFYRREGEDSWDARAWAMGPREVELAACRTFFLRDPRGEGDEILHMLPVFDGPQDASDKLRWWLARDDAREKAAAAAREAIADRTFEANAKRLLKLLDK